MKKLIALLLLLASPVLATDWYVYFNDVTNVFKYGQNRGTNITTMTLGFGDVWTKSNNVFTGVQTITNDGVQLTLNHPTAAALPAATGFKLYVDSGGVTWLVGAGAGAGTHGMRIYGWGDNDPSNDDPTMYLDNYDVWFRRNVVVTGTVTTIGALTVPSLTLSTPRWEDLRFPAIQSTKKGSDNIAIDENSNTMGFATSATTNLTDDHLFFVAQVPHSYYQGSDLHPHIHFWQDNVSQTSGFWLRFRWHNLGDTNIPAWTVIGPSSNVQAYASGSVCQLAEFPAMTGSGKTVSSMIDLKLYRDGTIGSGTIQLHEFDIHFQSDTPGGSANEFTK